VLRRDYKRLDLSRCQVVKIIPGDDGFALFVFRKSAPLRIIASWGEGWDHVSVTLEHRVPTWEEMCFAKELLFEPDDCVVQFHPPASRYINNHPYCLHLWRPQAQEILLPPGELV
jgi:hypothetical protein